MGTIVSFLGRKVEMSVLILWNIIVILIVPLVSYQGVRPMKTLFIPPFVVLTVVLLTFAVCASDALTSELVVLRELPTYSVPHTMEKPPEVPIALPEPLVLLPFLPMQNRQPPPVAEAIATTTDIVRGQLGTTDLAGILDTPPPLARGPVGADMIDLKLIDDSLSLGSDFDILAGLPVPSNPAPSGTISTDPLGNGVLVAVTVFTTFGLIYMAFVAFDYRQRWMNSLMTQNDRYIVGGTFDMDAEDMYGGSASFSGGLGFSDGFLKRHTI